MRNRKRSNLAAFTLTELLIVIGIIVLMMGLAVPAFNLLAGTRSIEGAQNQFSAFLSRARTEAIGLQEVRGVALFYNPRTLQNSLAIVRQIEQDNSVISNYDPARTYGDGDYVAYTISVNAPVHYYASNSPPTGTAPPAPGTISTQYWVEVENVSVVDLVSDTDYLNLPSGVGMQFMNDPNYTDQNGNVLSLDRYVSTGIILFDKDGKLAHKRYSIATYGKLGRAMALGVSGSPFSAFTTNMPPSTYLGNPPALYTQPAYSQFGAALYERANFDSPPYNVTDTDYFLNPTVAKYNVAPAGAQSESSEEAWLDKNTTPILINRYNGTLIKGE